jgi:heme exporter protein C
MNVFRFASPSAFFSLATTLVPWFAGAAALCAIAGLYIGLVVAPTDAQQGEVYRIIFIHVPAAWMAMFVYLVMAGYSALTLIFKTRLSGMMTRALGPSGALMAVIALITGAIWGEPTWGTWWVWDARLTSTLILLFLYLGYLALVGAIDDPIRGDKAGALLLLVGVVNVPIIYFSVRWWNTLHQGASISLTTAPKMAHIMLIALLLMSLAAWFYTLAISLHRLQSLIIERECHTRWVRARFAHGVSPLPPATSD